MRAAETGPLSLSLSFSRDGSTHLQRDLERFLKSFPLEQVSYGTGHRVHPLGFSRAEVPNVVEAFLDIFATPQAQSHHSLFTETNGISSSFAVKDTLSRKRIETADTVVDTLTTRYYGSLRHLADLLDELAVYLLNFETQ